MSPPTPSFSYSYSYRGVGAPLDPTSPNGADAAHDDAETETIGIPYAATRPHASHLPAVIVDAYDLNYSSVDRRRAREAALPALNIGAERGAPLIQPEPSISASPSAEPEHETEEGGTASSSATPSPAIIFAPPESSSASASTSHTPFSSHDTPASPSTHAEKRSRASRHPAHPHSQWHTQGAGHRDQDQDRKRYKGRGRQASDQGAERARYGDADTERKRERGRYGNGEKREGFSMAVTRRPPGTPVLAEEFRYCRRCNFVRPPRAHHCRACGTVRGCLCFTLSIFRVFFFYSSNHLSRGVFCGIYRCQRDETKRKGFHAETFQEWRLEHWAQRSFIQPAETFTGLLRHSRHWVSPVCIS